LFGVVEDKCYCFTNFSPPSERLAIGSCSSVDDGVPDEERMEVYFATALTTECNDPQTQAVRDALVLQDSAQFGYDIVENEFRDDIFDFFADECGTNIYEVQAQPSETTGSLRTIVSGVREFATSRRTERARSYRASVEGGYSGALFSASVSVSATADSEQNSLLETEGANGYDSEVFTSLGVRRVAEVKLDDYDNKFSFISFNTEFGNLLTAYRNSGYSRDKGNEIIKRYGQFVLTRCV